MTSVSPSNFGYGTVEQLLTSNGIGSPPSMQDPLSPGYASGYYYYINPVGTVSTTSQGILADLIYVFPFVIYSKTTFQNISFNVTSAGANLRLGLYNYRGIPLTVNQTLGVVDVSGTGVKTLGVALTLNRGWYGFALQCDSAVAFSNIVNTQSKGNLLPTGTSFSAATTPGMLDFTGAYAGGLIDLTGLTATINSTQPIIGFQVA